jgi:Ca-activated chloride channel homolog
MLTRTSLLILALIAILGGASLAAQGIVIDRRPPMPPRPPMPRPEPPPRIMPIEIRSHAVETTIDNQGATTTVTQVFYNPNPRQLEGQYLFPLPHEVAINDFQMTMNGEMVGGELLPAAQARKIYEDTVRRMIDPGLLEYAGRGLFRARVFPIEPRKELTIKFSYTELLTYDSGLVRFAYPLRTRNFSPAAPKSVTVKVSLKSEQALRTIYSPTHSVEIVRDGEKAAVIGLELKDSQPAHDFELFYGFAEGAVSANVMSFREGDEAGYFLALLTPQLELDENAIIPKDVVLVLDTSGSMAGEKIVQARNALKYCVNTLNEHDRFAIVTFATASRKMHEEMVPATAENRQAALERIEGLRARGGTNFHDALKDAYELAGKEEGRPCYVVILTDGMPTMGEITNVQALAKMARENRASHVRVFPFGVGYDVNTWLIDTLAEENRGQREYVKPEEDIELKVSNFANKIASPVLSDVKLSIRGAEIHDLHPQTPGDVFAGTQLSILGRFEKPGKYQLVLEGSVRGEKQVFEYNIEFTASDTSKAYLPRMWAVRRVGFLMDQINMRGANKELEEEIVRLGTRFGIVTPYTSFLIVEDTPATGTPAPRQPGRRAIGGGIGGGAAPAAPEAQRGRDGVERSGRIADRREAGSADAAAESERGDSDEIEERARRGGFASRLDRRRDELRKQGMSESDAAREAANVVRTVGTRSFVWSEGTWIESDLTNSELEEAKTIEYLSDEWFKLAQDNAVARLLAVGPQVALRVGNEVIRVIETEEEKEPEGE